MTMAGMCRSAPENTELTRLSAGVRRWIAGHAEYIDSAQARAELPSSSRVKAILQLGLVHHYWTRVHPDDEELAPVTAFMRRMWQQQDFAGLIAADPQKSRVYDLMYCAVGPAGITTNLRDAALSRLRDSGYLALRRGLPYARLTTRFYADLAGVDHQIESYPELYESSVLGMRIPGRPVIDLDVCEITHVIFFLTGFGFRQFGWPDGARENTLAILDELMAYYVPQGEWELTGKLVLARCCLGEDPLQTSQGTEGVQSLAHAQDASGAIPGRSAAQRTSPSAPELEFFRKAYQATLVTALMCLVGSQQAQPI